MKASHKVIVGLVVALVLVGVLVAGFAYGRRKVKQMRDERWRRTVAIEPGV